MVNLLIIKLVKFHENFIVSLSTTAINETRIAKESWLQVNCRKSSETTSGLQIRLNHGLPCLVMLEAYHKLHPKHKSLFCVFSITDSKLSALQSVAHLHIIFFVV